MAAEDLVLGMMMGALGSLILWVTIGRKMMLKYAGLSVVNALRNPNKETKEAIHVILGEAWVWFLEPSIKTGKTIKVGEGEEEKAIPEVLSPFQSLVREIGKHMVRLLRSSLGGTKSQSEAALAADLADPNSPLASSLGGIFPRLVERGRKGGGEGIMGVIEDLGLGPIVRDYIKAKLQSTIGGQEWK